MIVSNRVILALMLIAALFVSLPMAYAGVEHEVPADADADHHESLEFKRVEPKLVCMMNNKFMGTEQISVEVDGKIYYGCCPMCKERLKNEASARQAIDPISGNTVDKAAAIIGAAPDEAVYYFENETNFEKFSNDPARYIQPATVEP